MYNYDLHFLIILYKSRSKGGANYPMRLRDLKSYKNTLVKDVKLNVQSEKHKNSVAVSLGITQINITIPCVICLADFALIQLCQMKFITRNVNLNVQRIVRKQVCMSKFSIDAGVYIHILKQFQWIGRCSVLAVALTKKKF